MRGARIGDHAIIGDGRSAALITRDGSIDWLCWPRFDSPAIFSGIVDPRAGGYWQIAPTAPARATRSYVGDSNVLVTELETAHGLVRLTDWMPIFSEQDKRSRLVPEHELLRRVECVRGEVALEMRFEPRLDYGRRPVRLRAAGALGIRIEDGAELYTLRAEIPLELDGEGAAFGAFSLRDGERRHFSLSYDAIGPAILPPLGTHSEEALSRSTRWWREWAARCSYQGPYRDHVLRSLLVLKLLSFAPSGAIVAAPTTSLPERIAGDLNWDYRYCWIRDAALTVRELLDLGYVDDAAAFAGWLMHATRLTRPELGVLYDVYGERPRRESVLGHLAGHRASRPVRIGNAAADQLQLDVYGELIDAVSQMCRRGAMLDRETCALLLQFGRYVCDNWRRPDQGIWEPRTAPAHHTHSLLLCWTALDRLIELHELGLLEGAPLAELDRQRAELRRVIEERAWNAELQSYTQVLGEDRVDASLLLLPWYGFVSAADPRMCSTFRLIRARLEVAPSLLRRYEQSHADGEGAFGICSFWAAEYLARGGGTLEQAERWFERLLDYENDVGLLAEEIDPQTGEALGNFPQAFTHVGLISAAIAIEERRTREAA